MVKDKFTNRERKSISRYLENSFGMIKNWSIDRAEGKDKEFKEIVRVKDETWVLTDNFLYREGKGHIKKLIDKDIFILTHDIALINDDFNNNNIQNLNFVGFDSFIECCKRVHIVSFNREIWAKSKCTCWYYLKKYHCYHIFVIAVNERLITIPIQYKILKLAKSPR